MSEQPGPADVFDPTPDGYDPKTLAEVIAAGRRAVEAAAEFLDALHGCRTPLNLRPAAASAENAAGLLEGAAGDLSKAEAIISSEAPLAAGFTDEEGFWTESRSAVLSPRQIMRLAKGAKDMLPEETVSYAAVIQETAPVPSLILSVRRTAEYELLRESRRALYAQLLADMESKACEGCHAEPGQPCLTGTGNLTGPHAARRKASALAAEHEEFARTVRRVDPRFL